MVVINRYQMKRGYGKKYYIRNGEVIACPICGGSLEVIGSRKRKPIAGGGKVITLIIRRLRCKTCRKIHHELPDIVMPYKRHCTKTIEKIIASEATEEVICEESTIRRIKAWWAAYRQYFESILTSLGEKYGVIFAANPKPREVVRAVANANLWIHTRSAFLSG